MKLFFTTSIAVVIGISSIFAQTITIDAARAMAVGSSVTVEGIVTNGNELGAIRYIQDGTAGLGVYSTAGFSAAAVLGAQVRVTGTLKDYNGLLEMDPVTSYTILSTGNPSPIVPNGTPADIGEANEGELVKIVDADFTGTGNFVGNTTYPFIANGQPGIIYLRNGHPLVGTPIPTLLVSITGIVSQYDATGAGTDGYQLLPRTLNDIQGFFVSSPVIASNLTQNSVTGTWGTSMAGSTGFRYGLTPAYELGYMNTATNATTHTHTFSGLQPADLVYVRAFSVMGSDTAWANPAVLATVSASTGVIQTYFNHAVDLTKSNGVDAVALTGAQIEQKLIDYINGAQTTIDGAFYNINRTTIVNALNEAQMRGVRVRYVTDIDETNTALSVAQFPISRGNPTKLMHDKFMIVDAGSVNTSYVWTGSMNLTDNNIAMDNNNVVIFQDQSLAKGYTIEFEEMFGSNTATPNPARARFGVAKKDNTPHEYIIGGKRVESYFSPTDLTETYILRTVNSATTNMEFALLTFTSDPLGLAVCTAKSQRNVDVHGIVDAINDTGSEFGFLQTCGVSIIDHLPTYDCHHKFVTVDADNAASDPQVVTGSHNWSSSANTGNDENTVIIHDASVADIFQQGFYGIWNILVSTTTVKDIEGLTANVFPNPATDYTTIQLEGGKASSLNLLISTANGQLIAQQSIPYAGNSQNVRVSLAGLPTGNYYITVNAYGKYMSRTIQIVK